MPYLADGQREPGRPTGSLHGRGGPGETVRRNNGEPPWYLWGIVWCPSTTMRRRVDFGFETIGENTNP